MQKLIIIMIIYASLAVFGYMLGLYISDYIGLTDWSDVIWSSAFIKLSI
jgi:hypothetical protein